MKTVVVGLVAMLIGVGCSPRWTVLHPSSPLSPGFSPLAHQTFTIATGCGHARGNSDAACELVGVPLREELRARLGIHATSTPAPDALHLVVYILELRMGDFAALSPSPTYVRAHLVWRIGQEIVAIIETEVIVAPTRLQPGVRRRLEMAGRQLAVTVVDYVRSEQSGR